MPGPRRAQRGRFAGAARRRPLDPVGLNSATIFAVGVRVTDAWLRLRARRTFGGVTRTELTPKVASAVLIQASGVGIDVSRAELVRLGSNAVYRLSASVIARVGRPGQADDGMLRHATDQSRPRC